MYEATANARTQDALRRAHVERAAAFRWLVRLVFGATTDKGIPLGDIVLTESSR